MHSKLWSITHVATKVHMILWSFVVLTWTPDIIELVVACDTMKFILLSPLLVWSTPLGLPGQCGICMHQHSTSGIRRRRRWHSTYWHMAQCEGVGWLLWWFALMTKKNYIRERNVTIRSEIWTTNIRSLGFWDIREWVILWGLILRSLGCIFLEVLNFNHLFLYLNRLIRN